MQYSLLPRLALALSCAYFAACRSAFPGEGAISTDRPGLFYSPALVPRGALQLESGAGLARTADTDTWRALAQWRFGLAPRVELRATAPNVLSLDGVGVDEEGLGDTEVGAKFAIGEETGGDSTLALITSLRLPTGESALTAHRLGYGLFLAASRPLTGGTTVIGLAGVTRTPSGSEDVDAGQLALVLARPLGDSAGGYYVEVSSFPSLEHGPSSAYAGAGLAWLLQPNLQLDFSVDDEDSTDMLAGVGLSTRW